MVKAAIIGIFIVVFMVLIARLQLPTDIEGLHVAVGGIFLVGVLVGGTAVAMFSDEIKEG